MREDMQGQAPDLTETRKCLASLKRAVDRNRSRRWKLSLWSKYIRTRDGGSCVSCKSKDRVQAHHIVRKVLYPHGAFDTGNGISLCWECHRAIHENFNRKPDLQEPLGAEGGDDQDEWFLLFGLLRNDALEKNIPQDEFYYFSDQMLSMFYRVQGYEHLLNMVAGGKITRITYAHEVWRNMPEKFYKNYVSELVRLNY